MRVRVILRGFTCGQSIGGRAGFLFDLGTRLGGCTTDTFTGGSAGHDNNWE